MYRNSLSQLEFEDFHLPFGGRLRSDNRWVKLAKLIPWAGLETLYAKNFSSNGQGAPAKSVRIALGALIIKERLGTSDEETVEQIRENPYLQYFLGLPEYQEEAPFDASMFVHFRKRFDMETLNAVNECILEEARKRKAKKSKEAKKTASSTADDPSASPEADRTNNRNACDETAAANSGKLVIDATCAPADIAFPTDLNLLNRAREKAEKIIDLLHAGRTVRAPKPRTYRNRARKDYLTAAKNRKLPRRKRRKALRKQLNYLKRDLKHIDSLSREVSLGCLSRGLYQDLLVIQEVYRQQQEMYDQKVNRIADRIVSLSQPHVRPIVRGKVTAPTEFGAKISIAVVDGFSFLDRLSWDAYNEANDLKAQVEAYRRRFGCYPASVHGDKIYRTRANRTFCKAKGIRFSGPPLGRPPKITEANKAELAARKRQQALDEIERNQVEGKFGQGKRHYGLGCVMTKLAATSESAISITFLVMNLKMLLSSFILLVSTLRTLEIRLLRILLGPYETTFSRHWLLQHETNAC